MNKAALVEEVRLTLGLDTDESTRIGTWLNLAIKRLARLYNFKEMRQGPTSASTVVSQKNYTYIGDWALTRVKELYDIRLIDGSSSIKLVKVNTRRFDTLVPYPEQWSIGRPSHYVPWGTGCDLWKIPDEIYTLQIKWVQFPNTLTSDSDEPVYTNKDDLLIALTCSYGYKATEEFDIAKEYDTVSKQLFLEAVEEDRGQEEDEIFRMEEFSMDERIYDNEWWSDPFVMRDI